MARKRERLEVIYDILYAIQSHSNKIKPTRLLHSSNLSPQMFREYIDELEKKGFIVKLPDESNPNKRLYSITKVGFEFIEKYKLILSFIDDFGL